jgi:hypothetical protein
MERRFIRPGHFEKDEDWLGNNAAFTCPMPDCGKVYIVSVFLHKEGRDCPTCGHSRAFVTETQSKGGEAWIEWPTP